MQRVDGYIKGFQISPNIGFGPVSERVELGDVARRVVLFFMHVRHSSKLTKLTVVSGFLWLAFMIFITMSDYWTRGWLDTFASGR